MAGSLTTVHPSKSPSQIWNTDFSLCTSEMEEFSHKEQESEDLLYVGYLLFNYKLMDKEYNDKII